MVSIVLIVAALAKRGEAANITLQVVIAYVEVEGNTSLPDPAPLNAFFRDNTSLVNSLFPSHPPLQLQKCNASLYQTPFDFYTIKHPWECSKPPGRISDPDQDRLVHIWERVCLISNTVILGAIVLCLIGLQLSKYSEYWQNADRPARWLREVLDLCHLYRPEREMVFVIPWIITTPIAGIFLGVPLYLDVLGVKHLIPVHLPDPGSLNHVLASNGSSITLYPCTVRDIFQAYVGFAESCDQLQGWFYPDLQTPETNLKAARGPGITFLMTVASIFTFASWIFFVLLVLYCFFFCWPEYVRETVPEWCNKVKKLFERRRVFNIEMQAPAGSGV